MGYVNFQLCWPLVSKNPLSLENVIQIFIQFQKDLRVEFAKVCKKCPSLKIYFCYLTFKVMIIVTSLLNDFAIGSVNVKIKEISQIFKQNYCPHDSISLAIFGWTNLCKFLSLNKACCCLKKLPMFIGSQGKLILNSMGYLKEVLLTLNVLFGLKYRCL